MNALRTVSKTSHAFRVRLAALAGLLLVGLLTSASLAGMKPAPTHGLGAALSLIAQQRIRHAQVNIGPRGLRHGRDGRVLLDNTLLRPGAIRRPNATAAAIVPISGAVQTFDIFNPPPAFRPLVGFGTAAALNNDPTNPPVYISNLAPTNLTPVWSQNEQFIIFSSNRTLTGGVQANGRYHLWAISVNGGEAFQITDSQTTTSGAALPAGGGEFFPALSPSNNALAFTSDAQSPGVQNLYALQSNSAFSPGAFSFDMLTALNNAHPLVNVSDPTVITSLTIRSAAPTVNPQPTGFSSVGRPTFSASEGQIVFPAFSTTGTNAGHVHLYFLNTNTRGFDANNVSFPGKLTDGPADDTDPAYSPDGQFIAFASTATSIQTNTNPATNSPDPSNPNNSQTVTAGGVTGGIRSIFLLSGGGSGAGFGTVVQGGQPGNTTQLPGGRISIAGTDNFGPAWSNFANPNQYTNPTNNLAYLAFSRGASQSTQHDIVYLQVVQGVNSPNTQRLTGETGVNPVVKLNTDDNAGETSTNGNLYDDAYPSWSPFLSIFSLTYSSNRTVTYNDPTTGFPREVAASIADNGQALNPDGSVSYTVGGGYQGILVSQLVNLDPPTLLRFNANEVVHVQAPGANPVTGVANKLAGSGANRTVTLTVRLSDREANIDDTGGPSGGPRVYVQIKDPDSKYQDGQNQEHKVFAKDRRYDVTTGPNPQANHPSNDITSGTMDALLDQNAPNPNPPVSTVNAPISGYAFGPGVDFDGIIGLGSQFQSGSIYDPSRAYAFNDFFPFPNKKFMYPSYGPKVGNIAVGYVYPRGVHGGQWPADAALNPDNTYVFVGKSGGGTNPGLPTPNNTPATQPVGAQFTIPGSDPRLFIPTGPEYETEVLNPQFASSGNANAAGGDPTPLASRFASTVANPGATVGDFVSPFWLAGVDDQGAFSGGVWTSNTGASALPQDHGLTATNGTTQTDRPTANYSAGGAQRPAEWLQLQRVPAAQQDNAGGVLYTINFTAPITGSDFYVDVIAYDKAAFPNIPNTGFQGKQTNWRIYDNVGGFSTNQNITNNDILVVSDYALGQKFAATTFGGRNTVQNLVPKIFGTESYLTDIDVSRLPDSVYGGFPIGLPPPPPITATSKPVPASQTYQFDAAVQPFLFGAAQNGLGVGSYLDDVIDDRARSADGNPNVQSQRYSVWRILSRGPVPQRVLNSYLPSQIAQPAVIDPGATTAAYKSVPAANVLDAHRCVIWLSPYTGDVLEDPGALDDPGTVNGAGRNSTTQNLTAFVQAGGRLCITGQDVGSTLTQGGTLGNAPSTNAAAPNFLPDVLNATLVSSGNTVRVLTGSQNRITGNPQFDQAYNGNGSSYLTLGGAFAIGNPNSSPPNDPQYAFPSFNNFFFVFPNYPFQDNLVIGDSDYGDSALSQIPPLLLPTGASLQGQPDTITAINGAVSSATYGAGGPSSLVYHDDPFGLPSRGVKAGQLPNGGTGSRVVYAAFGLESLTNDYYADVPPNTDSNDMNAPAFDSRIPPVLVRNPRSAILHNIVDFLRTGQVTGTITQTSGTGQGGGLGIDGATVYLVSATGAAPPTRVTFSATTRNGGQFSILGIEPGTYFLSAVKPGFQRAPSNTNTAFTVEGDVTVVGKTLTLTPLPNGSVAGQVKDTAGNSISGATVTLTSQDNSITQSIVTPSNIPASVNSKDNYFFQSVPVTNYTARTTGPSNPNGKLEYDAPIGSGPSVAPDPPNDQGFAVASSPTVDGVNFTLTPIPATILGRIYNTALGDTTAGAASAAGAAVNLLDSTGATVRTTTAATDGTYSLSNVPASTTPTTYTITVSKTGFGQPATPVISVTVYLGDVITGKDIGITPLASISGRIYDNTIGDTDVGGKSAGGATVTLTDAAGKTVATVSANPVAANAANGTYTFTGVPPGTYTITATKVGFATINNTTTATVTLGSVVTGKDIGLTPIQSGSITGTVTDAAGAGVAGALVTFVSADSTATLPATADGNGNYSLPIVFPGTYNGTATGPLNPNGRPTTTQGTVTVTVASAPAKTTANFSVVTIPPSVAGTVTDNGTSKGLASVLVTITDTATGTVIKTVKTDATGAYSTGPLPASGKPLSQYTITITASLVGYATLALPSQSIYYGDALTNQNFALVTAAKGSVSGQVTDVSTGAGVSGAVVTFVSTDGTTTLGPTTTDTNGNYSIPPPSGKTDPSGNYIGSVTPPNNANGKPEFTAPPTQAITIPADVAQTVNFVLTEILATLSGTVLDNQTGLPISGATVTLTDSTGKTVGGPVTTGANGTYAFASIPTTQQAAAYALSATSPSGYFSASQTVTLSLGDKFGDPASGQGAVNIRLDEKGIITGLVTDGMTGQPLPNVALTITDTKTNATVATTTTTPGTTVGPDRKTSNYTATFVLAPGDTYSVSATKATFNPPAAVKVTPAPLTNTQVGRADIQLTSGVGTLGGLVSDATTNAAVGGATVTITSVNAAGASTVVATFTTNGSISPAPDGATQGINYAGQVAQGSYTATLTFGSRTPVVQKVTVAGGQFNRLDFTGANGAPPIFTFSAGLKFLSTPYDYSSLGFDALFGILNTAPAGTLPNGNRTHVAVWDPTVGQYALDPNAPADSLRLGIGYWVFLKNPVPVTVQGAAPTAPFVPVTLHPSWNQIGVPNTKGVPVSSLMFDNGAGSMITFATAASSQYHVVSPTLYSFDGIGYQPVTQSSVLQPWTAYWIKVFSNATIEIPTK